MSQNEYSSQPVQLPHHGGGSYGAVPSVIHCARRRGSSRSHQQSTGTRLEGITSRAVPTPVTGACSAVYEGPRNTRRHHPSSHRPQQAPCRSIDRRRSRKGSYTLTERAVWDGDGEGYRQDNTQVPFNSSTRDNLPKRARDAIQTSLHCLYCLYCSCTRPITCM